MNTIIDAMFCPWDRQCRESAGECPMKVSILVPAYNTPKEFLEELLLSVRSQTYMNWELCLADASANDEVESVVRQLAETDGRIRYRRLDKNLGISGNTNVALEMATGEIVALLDHDDLLHPSAVYAVAHAIIDEKADFVYTDEITFVSKTGELTTFAYKPDYDPFYLLGANYICHFSAFRRDLIERAGGAFRSEFDGSQDHDLILRLTERASKVVHVREALYFWRAHGGSVAESASVKSYAVDAGIRAVSAALKRRGLSGTVESVRPDIRTIYRIRYDLPEKGKVSIVIPTRDHEEDMRTCLDSVFRLTTYPNYEIVVVDNGTEDPSAARYLKELQDTAGVRVVRSDAPFNFSDLVNLGVSRSTGEYVVLLNNDTIVITPEWIEEMVAFARLPEVGAVGAKLYYPDGTVQHAGVILGQGGVAGHAFLNCQHDDPGANGRMVVAHQYSVVTGACLMVRRTVFDQVGGFDPQLAVAFNDVDFCMRLRTRGYSNVWTPFAELYHCESKSRGSDLAPDKIVRFKAEIRLFFERWKRELEAGDPFYHPRYSHNGISFSIQPLPVQKTILVHVQSDRHRKLPFPISKVVGGVYCLQDNGLRYTWKRFWNKVHHRWEVFKISSHRDGCEG